MYSYLGVFSAMNINRTFPLPFSKKNGYEPSPCALPSDIQRNKCFLIHYAFLHTGQHSLDGNHPYARYSISAHEKCTNTSDIDDSLDSLDLSVIYRHVQQSPMELTVPARACGQEQIELLPEQVHGVLSNVLQACESLNRSNIKTDTTEA